MAEGKDLFQVEIITPDRIFFAGEADMLEFNTADGEIGVYTTVMNRKLQPSMQDLQKFSARKLRCLRSLPNGRMKSTSIVRKPRRSVQKNELLRSHRISI